MGPNSENLSWYAICTIWVMIILNFAFVSSYSLAINNITNINDPTKLDDYLYNYSSISLGKRPHTGVMYNISLPANFSDMEVAILRLRSYTLWSKGVNSRYFDIPPKVVTMTYVKRLAIMYENLGNLSTQYYDLPGYTLLTKVIGFAIYNASDSSARSSKRLNISLNGEEIKVKFSQREVILSQERNNDTNDNNKLKKCVTFDPLSGLVELRDMLRPNVCLSPVVGHFAIAMPTLNDSIILPPPSSSSSSSPSHSPSLSSKNNENTKIRIATRVWWVVGFMVFLVGLTLLVLYFVLGIGSRKIQKMEKTAENSETLETKWIGESKLPFAPVSRAHAVLDDLAL